jgi:hypothetical protein
VWTAEARAAVSSALLARVGLWPFLLLQSAGGPVDRAEMAVFWDNSVHADRVSVVGPGHPPKVGFDAQWDPPNRCRRADAVVATVSPIAAAEVGAEDPWRRRADHTAVAAGTMMLSQVR